MNISKGTGFSLIILPIAFNVVFFLLQRNFECPDILRKPTDYILSRFNAGSKRLIMTWYAFAFTGVLFIPVAFLVHRTLASDTTPYMPLATAIGVLAGVFQCLGLIRWPFLVPYLARTYYESGSSQATKDSIAVIFQ